LPVLLKCFEKPGRVPGRAIEEDVDIAGESNMSVENHRLASDDHETDPVIVQLPEKLQDIWREQARIYGLG